MVLKENLSRLIQAIREDPRYDLEEIKELIVDSNDEEIRSSSKQFLQLCHSLTEALVKTKRSVGGINLLSHAITRYQQDRSQLTPLHSDFCLLCLDAKCLNPALTFLEIDYTQIRKTDDRDEDAKRVLLFYYYGGLIYTALKNFERASYYWEVVLTVPASVMSPIMLETYKKFILLNILINGKLQDNLLPKYTSQCVIRQRKQVGHPYLKFAQEYSYMNHDKISRLVNNNNAVYERDENLGLIKQCLAQVHKRNIQRLTKTFLTLPLRDVANHAGLMSEREAELYLLGMIDDGEISAIIDQRNGMVVFQDDTERYDSVAIFHKLQEDISTTTTLISTLRRMEAESLASPVESRGLCKMNSDD